MRMRVEFRNRYALISTPGALFRFLLNSPSIQAFQGHSTPFSLPQFPLYLSTLLLVNALQLTKLNSKRLKDQNTYKKYTKSKKKCALLLHWDRGGGMLKG